MKIAIVVFDNFTDIDVFLPWDLFNRARFRNKELEVKTADFNFTILNSLFFIPLLAMDAD